MAFLITIGIIGRDKELFTEGAKQHEKTSQKYIVDWKSVKFNK